MAVLTNTITTNDVVAALDIEMASKFDKQFNQLLDLMGVFGIERVAAGTALYQYTVDGSIAATPVAEGDEVPLSKYAVTKTPIGEMDVTPYRKLTTAQAILKGGFVGAVLRTDDKMISQVRQAVMSKFFSILMLESDQAPTLQAAIAYSRGTVQNALEANGEATEGIVTFISRDLATEYLAKANITTQNAFGMTYIENFLGAEKVFVTNMVDGVVSTPVENIHVYAIDWDALAESGLGYYTSDAGLIGVHHEGNYARTSSETFVLAGVKVVPEMISHISYYTVSEG